MDGRNWDWHNVVDVSPFLLYESTGDSEANSEMNMENLEIKNYEADDALSCCSDSYDATSFGKYYNDRDKECAQSSKKKSKNKEECYARCLKKKSKKKEQDYGYNPIYRDCNDDDDEDDGAINQVWSSCGKMGYVVSRQQKKNGKSNIVMEPKEENDKLFWDTCLGT